MYHACQVPTPVRHVSTVTLDLQVCGACNHRYADVLAEYHDDDHLVKFEELLEAAVDLDKIPDEYLICASYDAGLQVCAPMQTHAVNALSIPLHLFAHAFGHASSHALTHTLAHALIHALT